MTDPTGRDPGAAPGAAPGPSADREGAPAEDRLKRCARCAAYIPDVATMCSYCGTTSPDALVSVPQRNAVGLPRWVTVHGFLMSLNLAWFVVTVWTALAAQIPAKEVLRGMITGRGLQYALDALGAFRAWDVAAGDWHRLLASTTLHAGIVHLGMNLFSLRDVGRSAEAVFGGPRLMVLWALGGLAGVGAHAGWEAFTAGDVRAPGSSLVGASGALCAVVGALTAWLLRNPSREARRIGWELLRATCVLLAVGWLVPFVSNAAHVGGLLLGGAFGSVVAEGGSFRVGLTARRNWALAAAIAGTLLLLSLAVGAVRAVELLRVNR